jgi:hypothetical protein
LPPSPFKKKNFRPEFWIYPFSSSSLIKTTGACNLPPSPFKKRGGKELLASPPRPYALENNVVVFYEENEVFERGKGDRFSEGARYIKYRETR